MVSTTTVTYFLMLLSIPISQQNSKDAVLMRQKRFLLYPRGTTHKVQVITGVGLPVDLERETAIVGIVFKANYLLPQNVSDITQPTVYARKKRALSRWDIYNLLIHAAEIRGLPGKPCILRAICEAAEVPMDTNYGLFEEILHHLFTPTSTDEELNNHTDNEYFAAQHLGVKGEGTCKQHFPDCKVSLLDMITLYDKMLN